MEGKGLAKNDRCGAVYYDRRMGVSADGPAHPSGGNGSANTERTGQWRLLKGFCNGVGIATMLLSVILNTSGLVYYGRNCNRH